MERTIRVGEYVPTLTPGTRMAIRNAGQDELVLYQVHIAPAGAEGG